MGWTVPYDRPHRADLIRERTEPKEWTAKETGARVTSVAIKHCYRGGMRSGVLYIVWERTTHWPDGKTESMRFIEVDLLRYQKDGQCGSTWGYKDMDCCCGPCQRSCPASYLEMCPPHAESKHCADWHKAVRAHHEERRQQRAAV